MFLSLLQSISILMALYSLISWNMLLMVFSAIFCYMCFYYHPKDKIPAYKSVKTTDTDDTDKAISIEETTKEITADNYNSTIHIAEYKRTCRECGKIWHSLKTREQVIKMNAAADFCGVCGTCGSPHQAQYSRNIDANIKTIDELRKCPVCGSFNYAEIIIYYKKHD